MHKTFTLLVQFIGLLILTAHPAKADAPTANAVRFVQNKGQWDGDILFRADLPSGFLFLKKQSLHYVFYDSEALDALHFGRSGASTASGQSAAARQASVPTESMVRAHGIDVQLANSLSTARIEPKNKVSEHLNYFLGNDPNRWASAVPSFAEIIYHDIYPGIDLRLFAYYQTLKYEFLVRPGADPAAIRLRYEGAAGVRQEGEQLLIETTLLPFQEGKPYSFTEKEGKTTEVPTAWKLDNRTASFQLPNGYDASQPLTIDPTLIFSTYSGSTSDNWGHTATYDSTGNLYTAGTVFGSTFKATTGAFQTQLGGEIDVAVLKFSPDGKQLQYATYLGGANGDTPHSLIVNSKNELLIYGVTSSANFPTTASAYSRRFAGGTLFVPAGNSAPSGNVLQGIYFKTGSDLYIAKLSTDGRTLRGSTYVGGSGNDGISDATRYLSIRNYGDELRGEIIVDPSDNVYVATVSFSDDFPVTANAPQRQRRGTADAVLIELNSDLSQLLWSTYFGGSGYDVAYAVRQGASGAVYAVGTTRSPDLPGTTGALKTTLGGNEDGFLVKFAGNSLERATYLGTTADDAAYLLDLDPEENPHVLGLTRGKYPVSDGIYQNVNSGQFIHALDPTLTRTVFSTVIGSGRAGITDISPTAFLVNDCGNIYLSGWGGYVNTHTSNLTSSTTGLPVTADAYRKTTDGSNYWLVLLERRAKSMLYATFFGSANLTGRGDHVDGGTSRFDKSGVIYHAACACGGSRFPTTAQAWSATNNSNNCNNAAFKFDIDRLEAAFDAFQGNQKDVIQGCSPLTLNFVNTSVGGVTYQWNFGDNTTATTATQVSHTFSKPGEYVVVLTAYNKLTCQQVDTAQKIIKVFPADFKVSKDTTVCPETPFQLLASGGRTYQWSPATGLSSTTVANPTVTPKQTTQYVVRMTNEYGCSAQKTVTVTTDDSFRPVAQINTGAECGKAMKLELVNRTQGADSLRWTMDNGDTLRMATPGTYQYAESGHYNVTVTAYKGVCRLSVVIPVDVENLSEIPNVVTANGDGKNDVFKVGFVGAQLEIYNRWGRQIYKNTNYQNDWGHNAPYGTYYYLLTTPQGVRCKGWLQVLQ